MKTTGASELACGSRRGGRPSWFHSAKIWHKDVSLPMKSIVRVLNNDGDLFESPGDGESAARSSRIRCRSTVASYRFSDSTWNCLRHWGWGALAGFVSVCTGKNPDAPIFGVIEPWSSFKSLLTSSSRFVMPLPLMSFERHTQLFVLNLCIKRRKKTTFVKLLCLCFMKFLFEIVLQNCYISVWMYFLLE